MSISRNEFIYSSCTDPCAVLGVRGHLRHHTEIVGVVVCFTDFVHGPPATRLAVHFRIRSPVNTQTKPLSHPSIWYRNKLLICLRSLHQSREIIFKPIYWAQTGEKLRDYGKEAHKHSGHSYFYSQLAPFARPHPWGCSLKTGRWFTKNVIGVA